MKILKYNLCDFVRVIRVDPVTEEITEQIEEVLTPAKMTWSEANEEIVKKEAYKGEYTIEDDGVVEQIPAPRNILSGEYVTIEGVLYLATENIPNGEPIIVGQNAVKTSVEEQLYAMKGE